MNALSYNISKALQNETLGLNNQTDNNTLSSNTPVFYIILKILMLTFVLVHIIYLVFMIIKINYCNKDEQDKKKIRKLNDDCSICLESCHNEAQLLCSHSFCGQCLLNHYQQNFLNEKVKCPYCRAESKFIIPQFEENEENKEIMKEICKYNDQVTSMNKTSFCLCVDFLKFSFLYLKKILNLRNERYINHRRILFLVLTILILFLLYPLVNSNSKGKATDIIKDIIFYLLCIIFIANALYRRIRYQNMINMIRMNMAIQNEVNADTFNEGNFNV